MILIDGGPEGYYCGDGSGIGIKTKIDKMDSGITAEWARKRSNEFLGEEVIK